MVIIGMGHCGTISLSLLRIGSSSGVRPTPQDEVLAGEFQYNPEETGVHHDEVVTGASQDMVVVLLVVVFQVPFHSTFEVFCSSSGQASQPLLAAAPQPSFSTFLHPSLLLLPHPLFSQPSLFLVVYTDLRSHSNLSIFPF